MTNLPPIDLAATGFSLNNARACLVACRWSYDQPSGSDGFTDASGFIYHSIPGVQIIDCGNCIVVAFEGSRTWADWMTDFRIIKTYTKFGCVHKGAWRRHLAQNPAVAARLQALGAGPGKPVMWAGHSLGAWLATFGAIDSEFPVLAVYTFEGPRPGNGQFRRVYNSKLGSKTFRFVYEEDVVPRVPLWTMGYRHVGQLIFMPADAKGYAENPSIFRVIASDLVGEITAWLKGGLKAALAAGIDDHPLANDEARFAQLTQP